MHFPTRFFKFVLPLLILFLSWGVSKAEENKPAIHLFVSNTCPHCAKEKAFLEQIAPAYPNLTINTYEISENFYNLQLMVKTAEELDTDSGAVPFLVVGGKHILGFAGAETTGVEIENAIKENLANPQEDVVTKVLKDNPQIRAVSVPLTPQNNSGKKDDKPVFELKLDLESLPLPVFTFVVALMDGFNPCAMWALLFLISLLLGTKDRKKMWILGAVFIFTSGLVYFMFLAAWLNFFLLIGYAVAVRYVVGIFALSLGIYYLYDFYKNRGGCVVSQNEERRNFLEKIKRVVLERNLAVAIVGMIVLAAAVNMIELLCSAGLPAVYTKVLSMNNLPTFQYYLYLLFYILVFILDDLIVFVGAMITLEAFGLKNKYAKYSHLIGGVIVLLIGLALLFKPELLSFQ